MGKYSLTTSKEKLLTAIANELAEANRLKRLELMMMLKDKPDGWYEDLIDEWDELNGIDVVDKA